MKRIDLHVHSTCSDGTFTPSELVDYAISKELSAFALTDHDTVEGIEEAMTRARELKMQSGIDIEVVPGIELSTQYQGRDIHIVGLDIDYHSPAFLEQLTLFQKSRDIRNEKMCRNLQEAGIDITYEKLQEENPGAVITRSHYGEYLLKYNYVKSKQEAFDRYVGDHTRYFVPRELISPAQAVHLILEAGGIPILAHPVLYHMSNQNLASLTAMLKEEGLMGIEAIYSTYAPSDERDIRRLAKEYHLCISGGSDFHGAAKPRIDLGTGLGKLFVPDEVLNNLRLCKRKIFFSDLDGTLLNTQKQVTPETYAAVSDWMKQGNIMVLSSGRPLGSILEVIEKNKIGYNAETGEYDKNLYAIAFNGGLIYHVQSGKTIAEDSLDKDQIREIIRIAFEENVYCHAYDKDSILIPHDGPEIRHYTKTVHLPVKIIPDFQEHACDLSCKILCIDLEHPEKLQKVADHILERYPENVTCVKSNPILLEVFPSTAGKGNAIKMLCDHLNIPICNTLAAGDEQNDISMLETAGIGIAMQNASDLVKSRADKITTTDNDHDGLVPFFIGLV